MKAPVPAKLPHLHTILDNIGLPDKQVARFLGVSPSSVKRWREAGQAPRPVMLALFWETTWGMSAANAAAINEARMYFSENQILKRRIAALEKRLLLLEKEHEKSRRDRAANFPLFDVV